MKRLIASFFIFISLISCASSRPTGDILAKLEKGMTVFDVERDLGRPTMERYLENMKRVMIYKASDGYVVVFTENGYVTGFNPSTHIIFN